MSPPQDWQRPGRRAGPNITWHEITLESTGEPITTGIKTKLPWFPKNFEQNLRLDDSNYGANAELANILSWPDFDCPLSLQKPPLKPAL